MEVRLRIHTELKQYCSNVYFQPPENLKITFPAIIYYKQKSKEGYADNKFYLGTNSYDVTIIEKDPDSDLAVRIRDHFPMCSIDNYYVSDELHHTKLTIQR